MFIVSNKNSVPLSCRCKSTVPFSLLTVSLTRCSAGSCTVRLLLVGLETVVPVTGMSYQQCHWW